MRLEVDGQRYENFLSAKVALSSEMISRRFEFRAATRGVGDIPFRPGQSAAVWIDEDRILNGWVEKIEVSAAEGASEVTYTVSGRDLLADVVDSQVDGLGEFGATVAHAAGAVLRFLGVAAKVVARSTSGSRPFRAAAEVAKPEVGETAADFLWGVAARRQVVLTSDGDGNLVVLNGDPERLDARIVHRVDGEGNNVVGFAFTSDHSKRFHTTRVVSQQNVASLSIASIGMESSAVSTVQAEFVDGDIRPSRRHTIAGEATYSASDARVRARWETNLARAAGLVYEATVPSWRDASGALWRLNTAPTVEDEFAGILSRMAITAIDFVDDDRGETAVLTLRPPEVFASQAAVTELERRAQVAKDAKKGLGSVTIDKALREELEHMELR